jgi:Concanavalin A-like lectin/glucanases superfamily
VNLFVLRPSVVAFCTLGASVCALSSCAGGRSPEGFDTDAASIETDSATTPPVDAAAVDASMPVDASPDVADAPNDPIEDAPAEADAPVETADAAPDAPPDSGVPTVGLIGEWLCSGNANDTSGSGNDGTPTAISYVADRHGTVGSACSFDGSTSHIQIADAPSLGVTTTWSLSAWVNASAFTGLAGIFSKYQMVNADGPTVRLSYNLPYTGIDIDEATSSASSSGLLVQGTWAHVGVTVNGLAVVCYLDGVLAYSLTAGFTAEVNTNPLQIGLDYATRFFNGSIDDVRFYDRTLTAVEIQSLYVAP